MVRRSRHGALVHRGQVAMSWILAIAIGFTYVGVARRLERMLVRGGYAQGTKMSIFCALWPAILPVALCALLTLGAIYLACFPPRACLWPDEEQGPQCVRDGVVCRHSPVGNATWAHKWRWCWKTQWRHEWDSSRRSKPDDKCEWFEISNPIP